MNMEQKKKQISVVIPEYCGESMLPELLKRLHATLQTLIHYPIPPHKQRCYEEWHDLSLPVTERIHAQELSLPCHQAMTKEEAEQIVSLLNSFR